MHLENKDIISYKGKTFEEWADHWYYKIGVNVIPVNTRRKSPIVEWKQWQNKRISQELFEKWKEDGLFKKGMAIIPGRVWYITEEPPLYFVVIDLDSKLAIEEFCTMMNVTSIRDISNVFVIEQHSDNLERSHVGFYSEIAFEDKPADDKIGLEIKSNGKGLVNCCPSLHKNGYPYQILGTLEPKIVTKKEAIQYMEQIDIICKKSGLEYLKRYSDNGGKMDERDNKIKQMVDKFYPDINVEINEGSRHTTLLFIANKLLFKYIGRYKEDEIKYLVLQINQKCCRPEPLPDIEIEQIWIDAKEYRKKNRAANKHNDNTKYENWDRETRKIIISIINDNVEFFKDTRGKKYGRLKIEDHYEILNININFFKERITYVINESMKDYDEKNLGVI